jgi:hypothetical protein
MNIKKDLGLGLRLVGAEGNGDQLKRSGFDQIKIPFRESSIEFILRKK